MAVKEKHSTYHVAEKLSAMPGSIRDIAKATGISSTKVCALRKAWREASIPLKTGWKNGTIPFDAVRVLATKSKKEQIALVPQYLSATRNGMGTRKSKAEARISFKIPR